MGRQSENKASSALCDSRCVGFKSSPSAKMLLQSSSFNAALFALIPFKRGMSKTASIQSPMPWIVVPRLGYDEQEEEDDNISVIGSCSDDTDDAKSLWSLDSSNDVYVDKSVWSGSKMTNRLNDLLDQKYVSKTVSLQSPMTVIPHLGYDDDEEEIHSKLSSSSSSKVSRNSSSYPSATVSSLDPVSPDSGCTEIFYDDEGAQAILLHDELEHFENLYFGRFDAELPSFQAAKAHVTRGAVCDILDGLQSINSGDEFNYSRDEIFYDDGGAQAVLLYNAVKHFENLCFDAELLAAKAHGTHPTVLETIDEVFDFYRLSESVTSDNESDEFNSLESYSLSDILDDLALISSDDASDEFNYSLSNILDGVESISSEDADDELNYLQFNICDGPMNVIQLSAELSDKSQNVAEIVTNTSVVSIQSQKSSFKKTSGHLDDIPDVKIYEGSEVSIVLMKNKKSRVFANQSLAELCRVGKGLNVKPCMMSSNINVSHTTESGSLIEVSNSRTNHSEFIASALPEVYCNDNSNRFLGGSKNLLYESNSDCNSQESSEWFGSGAFLPIAENLTNASFVANVTHGNLPIDQVVSSGKKNGTQPLSSILKKTCEDCDLSDEVPDVKRGSKKSIFFKKRNISRGFEKQSPAETCKIDNDREVKLNMKNNGPSSPGKFRSFLQRARRTISHLNPFKLFKTAA